MRILAGLCFGGMVALGGVAHAQGGSDDPPADDRLQRADAAYRAGDDATALTLLEALRAENLHLVHVHRLLAQVYHRLGRDEEARVALSAALGQGRFTEDVLTLLVRLEQELGREAMALHALRALVLVAPDNPMYQLILADSLERQGVLEESLAVYEAMSRRDPAAAELELRKANLLLRLGRASDARATFERAYWLGHDDARLPRQIAQLWRSTDTPARALDWYRRVTDDVDDALLLEWATLAVDHGDLEAARQNAERLRTSEVPGVAGRAHWLLGQLAQREGDDQAALEHWSAARTAGFQNPSLDRFLGASFHRRGRHAEAIPLLRAVRAADPDVDTCDKLVRSLLAEGQRDEARAVLAGWLAEFGPGDRQRAALRAWIRAAGDDEG